TYQRNLQKKPFFLNADLHDLVQGMGEKAMQEMLGWADTTNLNKQHAMSVEGKNTSIKSALDTFKSGIADMQAKAGDRELHDIPVYFDWSIGSNMRANLKSSTLNPQRHKYHRELITGQPVQLDTRNKKQMRQFTMAVAQGLGVKVDRMSNRATYAAVQEKLNKPVYRSAVDVLKSRLGDYGSMTPADTRAVLDAVADAGEGMKSFHALQAQAKMEHAHENGYNQFMNHLTFELDGKTDGPANALVHFGSFMASSTHLDLLKKVGLFINDVGTALNVWAGQKGNLDIYETVAAEITRMTQSLVGGADAKFKESMRHQMALLQRSGNLKFGDIDDLSSIEAKRSMAKNPVTQTVYSAGDDAKIKSLRDQMQDVVYEALSDAIANGTSVDPVIYDAVLNLTGVKLNDPAAYKTFRFTADHTAKMDAALKEGMGQILNNAIYNVLNGVVDVNNTVRDAANAHHAVFEAAFLKARSDLLAAKRASGELASFNDLSAEDLQSVYDEVSHLAPVYHNALTSGTNPRDGMLMSKEARGNIEGYRVESLFGDSSEIPGMVFDAPGARPAPMMTISSGDATMMALYFLSHSNALNMYDGLEVMPGSFDQAAEDINKAVFQGWQFGLMRSISDGYSGSMDAGMGTLNNLSSAELDSMIKTLRAGNIPKGATAEQKVAMIQKKLQEHRNSLSLLADHTDANKSVMFNQLPNSTDHMAGHEQPVVNRADLDIQADPVTFIEQQSRAWLSRNRKAATEEISPVDAAFDRHLKAVRQPGENGIAVYNRAEIQDVLRGYLDEVAGKKARIPQFVLNQISASLPDDLQVRIGSVDNIAAHITEMFPDIQEGNILGAKGMTYGSQVFVSNRSAETVLHELVHAATQNQLNAYFRDATALTQSQRDSITALNRIMNDFMGESEFAQENPEAVRFNGHENVKAQVRMYLAAGNRAAALNEFVAWSLTNPQLTQSLQDTPNENKQTHILGRILKAIARLLGIGTAAQSYFTSIAGHVQEVMAMPPSRDVGGRATPLNQLDLTGIYDRLRSERTTSSHQAHLDQVFTRLKQNLVDRIKATAQPVAGITTAADQLNLDAIDPAISQAAAQFMASGYPMNGQEEMVFKMLQASLHTAFEAQPARAIEVRKLFNDAATRLTADDLGGGTLGEMRHAALFGPGQNSDAQLANFLAVAQVNQTLRDALREMFVQRKTQQAQNWEQRITGMVEDATRWLANLGIGFRSAEVQHRLDKLTKNLTHFEAEARQNVIAKATSGIGDSFEQLNNLVNQKKAQGAARLEAWVENNGKQLAQKIPNENARLITENILRGIAAMG
ncbi:hypothetical protein, partial [Pseudescherichia sp.]|uniref:hypothetical protein n=1 Tax=Pseudescherichia sp. TaxID=2055881 RepID=UPI0028B25B06